LDWKEERGDLSMCAACYSPTRDAMPVAFTHG
jgi:hypothetical protein